MDIFKSFGSDQLNKFLIINDIKQHPMNAFILYSGKVWRGKVWQIDSFQVFGERKIGELIDQPIGYQL